MKQTFVHRETCADVITGGSFYSSAVRGMMDARRQIEAEIHHNPRFLHSHAPVDAVTRLPVPDRMCRASRRARVGPMASVAGAVADAGVEAVLEDGGEDVLIENGGDISVNIRREGKVRVMCLNPRFSRLMIVVPPGRCGVCSSSSTFGRSFSYGSCDLATVVGEDACTCDAWATRLANAVVEEADIEPALQLTEDAPEVWGALIIKGRRIGMSGDMKSMLRLG